MCLICCIIPHFMIFFAVPKLSENHCMSSTLSVTSETRLPSTDFPSSSFSVSLWTGISTFHFPSKFQWGQAQSCLHLHSSFSAATRLTASFPRDWKAAGWHCCRDSATPHIPLGRRGSEPDVTGYRANSLMAFPLS